jgi:hypothetical protein
MEPPTGGRKGRHNGYIEGDRPARSPRPGNEATAGDAPTRSCPWPGGARLAEGVRPARRADALTSRCVLMERRPGRSVPDAPATSRHQATASAVPRPASTAPIILDELVEGAWETDGGRALQTRQDQRSGPGGRFGRNTMRSTRNRRGKSARMLTVGEIKRAICTHARLAPSGPSVQSTAGGNWRTKLTCPACGAWTIRETSDTASLTLVTVEQNQDIPTPAALAWERCAVELRCQERQARTYPLCRFEAIVVGPTGRAVIGTSVEFDNGIERAERQAVLDAFAAELLRDQWQSEPDAADGMPRFRRPADAPVPVAVT